MIDVKYTTGAQDQGIREKEEEAFMNFFDLLEDIGGGDTAMIHRNCPAHFLK